MSKKSANSPRCPVCTSPLILWATVADDVRAGCDACGWEWRG